MKQESEIMDYESAVNLFIEKGMSRDQSNSILIKLWFLFLNVTNLSLLNIQKKTSLRELFNSLEESWVEIISEIEYFKVSEMELQVRDILSIKNYFSSGFIKDLMSFIRGGKRSKREGFFITNQQIIQDITDLVKDNLIKQKAVFINHKEN